jgi:hypothetical protein
LKMLSKILRGFATFVNKNLKKLYCYKLKYLAESTIECTSTLHVNQHLFLMNAF